MGDDALHAKHSPSKLPPLGLCAGWESDPTPGPAAIRGTAIHGHLAEIVRGKDPIITDEDVRGPVDVGKALFLSWRAEWPDLDWMAEVKSDTGIPDCYGTADVVGASPWLDVAVVADWKSGRGDRDDAGASLQTAAYAYGILRAYPHIQRIIAIMAELEQEPTRCEFTRAQLEAAAGTIRQVVDRAASPFKQLNPSAKACQYCVKRVGCPAVERAVVDGVASLPAIKPESARDLSAADAGAMLTRYRPLIALVERFGAALEDRIKSGLTAGEPSPGWALKSSAGTRAWTLPDDQLIAAIAQAAPGVDVRTLATPAEMERRLAEYFKAEKAKSPAKEAAKVLSGICKGAQRVSLVESTP